MSVNFFREDCQSGTSRESFGIIDGPHDTKALLSFDNENKWTVAILNSQRIEAQFTAIDHCITILRDDGNQENSCDCMLRYADTIAFIELKHKRSGWLEEGIHQLEKTIREFQKSHSLDGYKHKLAIVANKRHPNFQVLENETMRRFSDNNRIRLNTKTELVIS